MMLDIKRRLLKLESQVPPPKPSEEQKNVHIIQRFLMCAVAYYLGDPTPNGSVADDYARALGYSHFYEFKKALEVKDPDFFERDRLARIRLLEKFGVSWECEWNEIVEAFRRMETGFSEHYKRVSSSSEIW
jgi:hypothetical protein